MAGWRERLRAQWFATRLAPEFWLLLPLTGLFAALVAVRRALYRSGLVRSESAGCRVVVVGNILVGGTGKTPLIALLAEQLKRAGRSPGIIARGYGGTAEAAEVSPDSDPAAVGDEPLLLARRCGVPVVVGRDRIDAARRLRACHPAVDVILSDDGLQHYRLHRDLEIAVFDRRGVGNGMLLPCGPLREPLSRLRGVDAIVENGASGLALGTGRRFAMSLRGDRFVSLNDPGARCMADALRGRALCAIAGIGDPQRFFDSLRALGLDFEARAFPDHHAYRVADLQFATGRTLLMTEKDAVKCRGLFAGECWFMPVEADVVPDLADYVLEILDGRKTA